MASTRILWSVALLSGTVTVYCSTGVNSIVYQLIAISTRATTSYDTYFEYNTSEKPNETKRRYQSQYGEWVAVFFFMTSVKESDSDRTTIILLYNMYSV